MKVTTGIKWGIIYSLIISLIATGLIYAFVYYPQLPSLEKEYYQSILNSTGNVTEAKLAEEQVPLFVPAILLYLNVISLLIAGAIAGFVIAKLWDRNPSWVLKGLMGSIVVLIVVYLIDIALSPLYFSIPVALGIGLLTSFKLYKQDKKS